jgi:sterol desaturase/sphingolipid hydroxylase (fatty acid hydroxylase superfamily)
VLDLPERRKYGINFALSLSVWDYLFGTAEVPYEGRDIKLGYPEDQEMPKGFVGQALFPLTKRRRRGRKGYEG